MKKKLLYLCSFVPYTKLSAFGFDMISIHDIQLKKNHFKRKLPSTPDSTKIFNPPTEEVKTARLAGNPCCFVKYCEKIDCCEYDGIIFTNCCNSTQRLYDYVRYRYQNIFTHLLEIPRLEIKAWNMDSLLRDIERYFNTSISHTQDHIQENITTDIQEKRDNEILIISSSLNKRYVEELYHIFSKYLLTIETCWAQPRGDLILQGEKEVSCPRMMNYYSYIHNKIMRAKAIIYITIQKCDPIMFAYPAIKNICESLNRRCLLVEEEYMEKVSENSRIRYDAFKECLEFGDTLARCR